MAHRPVTPYTLTLRNNDHNTDVWATLYVDGCKISKILIARGTSKDVLGIDDGTSTKELLFSFPRLMTSEHDKMQKERLSQVGEIKVVSTRATFLKTEMRRGGGASFDRCVPCPCESTSADPFVTGSGSNSFHYYLLGSTVQHQLPASKQKGRKVCAQQFDNADGQDNLEQNCRDWEDSWQIQCLQ